MSRLIIGNSDAGAVEIAEVLSQIQLPSHDSTESIYLADAKIVLAASLDQEYVTDTKTALIKLARTLKLSPPVAHVVVAVGETWDRRDSILVLHVFKNILPELNKHVSVVFTHGVNKIDIRHVRTALLNAGVTQDVNIVTLTVEEQHIRRATLEAALVGGEGGVRPKLGSMAQNSIVILAEQYLDDMKTSKQTCSIS